MIDKILDEVSDKDYYSKNYRLNNQQNLFQDNDTLTDKYTTKPNNFDEIHYDNQELQEQENNETFIKSEIAVNTDGLQETLLPNVIFPKQNVFKNVISRAKTFKWDRIIMRAIASYLIILRVIMTKIDVDFSTLDYVREVKAVAMVFGIGGLFVLLTIISRLFKKICFDGYVLGVAAAVYAVATIWRNNNFYYSLGIIIVVGLFGYHLLKSDSLKELYHISNRTARILVIIGMLVFSGYVGFVSLFRYWSYGTSCFDFGIFVQMYYNMTQSFSPETTCERNYLLSHFAVHFSPIYYLLLPIYYVFPRPETLLICQTLLVASGVIPLYLICKHYKLNNAVSVCLCFAYSFSPAIIGPCFFDFHENKFLPALLLWFLYAVEKKKWWLMYIFMVLLLIVKEDAAVYVACLGLFVMFGRKKPLHGGIVTGIAIGYFITVTKLMEKYGLGVMNYRYNNLITDSDKGLIDVIKTTILDPALVIFESFNEDKLIFFLTMLIPLAFLPLINKNTSQLFLVIPFLLFNLMSDYSYQYDMGFQYICGSAPLLIYLTVANASTLKKGTQKYVAPFIAMASIVLSITYWSGSVHYYDSYKNNEDRIIRMNYIFEQIPEDASVEANTFFIPKLAHRKEIYLSNSVENTTWDKTDYVILKDGAGVEEFVPEKIEFLKTMGYTCVAEYEDLLVVYQSPDYAPEKPIEVKTTDEILAMQN